MYVLFLKFIYLCTAISKSKTGGLAHLARARHWQCRGDRFESGNLHQKGFFRKEKAFFVLFNEREFDRRERSYYLFCCLKIKISVIRFIYFMFLNFPRCRIIANVRQRRYISDQSNFS